MPIFDLTAFDSLLDWSLAIERFLGSGDAGPAGALAKRSIHQVMKATAGRDRGAVSIKKLAESLEAFSACMSTCRGRSISQTALQLKERVNQCVGQNILPPLKPLLDLLYTRIEAFDGNQTWDGVRAANWCLEHNLIQQGYTILEEVLIGHLAREVGADPNNQKHRDLVPQAVHSIAAKKRSADSTRPATTDCSFTPKYEEYLWANPGLINLFGNLSGVRNDLNHAGERDNPMGPSKFREKLAEWIREVERTIAPASFHGDGT